MTETEWLTDPNWSLVAACAEPHLSQRRARMLAVALCRTRLPDFPDARFRSALDTIARFADGDATRDELEMVRSWVREEAVKANDQFEPTYLDGAGFGSARNEFAWAVAFAAATPVSPTAVGVQAFRDSAEAFRAAVWDVAGNPFRPVEFDPRWRTETVLALARRMYETREFSAMPILADALMDAGCDDEQVLAHCRGNGRGDGGAPVGGSPQLVPHVPGCWVLDGILGNI